MSKPAWYWRVAAAFAVHNAEEGIAAPLMLQLMQSRAPEFLRRFYVDVRVPELRGSLVILSVIGLCLAALAARSPASRAWSYVMLVFGTAMGLNGLAHVTLSIAWRDYMPGVVTAIGITIPVSLALFIRSHREAWISPSARWTLLPAAVVIHGPVLAAFLGLIAACAPSRPFPLADLDGVSRIEVRNPAGAETADVISDPDRVRRVVAAVHTQQSGWEESPHTLPAGDVVAVFYRDTAAVGVLWLGPTYVMARGRGQRPLIRSARPDELARLAAALELPVKVIHVPPRGGS